MYKAFSESKNIEKMIRQVSVYVEELTLQVTLLPFEDKFGKNIGHWIKYVSSPSNNPFEVYLYWDSKTEKVSFKRIERKLLKNSNHFKKMENYLRATYRDLKKITDKIYRNGPSYYKKLSNKKLIEAFNDINGYLRRDVYSYYIPYDLIIICNDLIRKEIKKTFPKYGKKEIEEIVKTLSILGINSLVKRENISFLNNLNRIQRIYKKKRSWKSKDIQKIIFEQWHEFGARTFSHKNNDIYSLKDYDRKFFKNLKTDSKGEMEKMDLEEKKEKLAVSSVIRGFRKNPRIIKYITWLRKSMNYRNYDIEKAYVHFSHALCLFDEISSRLKLKKDDIWLLSEQEIIDGLKEKNNVSGIAVGRRKKGFTIKQVGRKIKVITGVKPQDWHEKKTNKKSKSIKGMATFNGLVKGRVKIVIDPFEDHKKLKKNEILVTPMTTPEFVPLMKRAGAIITDEGGLLCHAAIVSRELKKPCIIGTKIATQVLKDGDLVKVDANEGVVRIIKRK